MSENRFIDAINRSVETAEDRAKLTNMATEASAGAPTTTTDESGPSDGSTLNFALNLEYLEAEFYLRGATGQGLPDDRVGRTGKPGRVSGGRQVDFRSPLIKNIAREIAMDERAHVAFLTPGSYGPRSSSVACHVFS
ncbi:ferritin-like domain-containing protein [Nonomuraea sp. B19D2]|uniref:ferritin-like domain-containing protein n=1 Tax=Nonomuraea sp. B19D2 TaxID=3159561 RepID=UPI0032D9D3F2